MRIILFLNRDLMSCIALNLLLGTLKHHKVWIVLSESVGKGNGNIPELQLLEKDLVNRILFPLLESQARRPAPGSLLTFKQVGQYYHMPIKGFENINSPEAIASLDGFHPDLFISIRYGQIFREKIIALPRYGILNLHSGMLPHYRGILGTFQAMRCGEEKVGCTLHYITDKGIDMGPIIGQSHIPVDKNRSLLWHIASLYEGGTQILIDALHQLQQGTKPVGAPQDATTGAYYSYPTAEQLQQFYANGYSIVKPEDYCELLGRMQN